MKEPRPWIGHGPMYFQTLFYFSLTATLMRGGVITFEPIKKPGLKKLGNTSTVTQCWRQNYSQHLKNS